MHVYFVFVFLCTITKHNVIFLAEEAHLLLGNSGRTFARNFIF